jgi:hypothetical protein
MELEISAFIVTPEISPNAYHIDPLQGNDRQISKYTRAVTE